jgi:PAS domain S-box-containing protein
MKWKNMPAKPTYEELETRVVALEAQERLFAEVEGELKRSLNFLESLLAAIPTAVFYKDASGRYQGCNAAFTEIMGVTADQIRGKTVHELWPSDQARVYHQKDLELLEKPQRQVYEFEVKDKHGRIRPVIHDKIDATIYVADMNTYEILFMNRNMIDAFGGDWTGKVCSSGRRRNDDSRSGQGHAGTVGLPG